MKKDSCNEFVVVTPIYEDKEAACKLFNELAEEYGPDIYIVAVDDGSINHPIDLTCFEKACNKGVIIKLKRNVGHQMSIAVGLHYISETLPTSKYIVVMDSDGEDIPSSISELLLLLKTKDVDVVVAHRKSRVETLRFILFYAIYKRLFKLLSGKEISFGNFMAMKPSAIKRMVSMQELSLHIAGCVLKAKLRVLKKPLDRGPRYAGQSKMNFVGLALHGFRALMVFADDVMVRVGIACATIAGMSVIGGITATILKIIGYATPGWFSVALGLLFLMFIQTGTVAMMTLMLSGVIRAGSVTTPDYNDFIDTILCTNMGDDVISNN